MLENDMSSGATLNDLSCGVSIVCMTSLFPKLWTWRQNLSICPRKKLPKGEKKIFFFFHNLFNIFPLPLRKKTKPLTFFPLFITGNRKTARENVLLKKIFSFFFLNFCTLPLLEIGKITTYLFFRNSDLKCPKMPLSALKFHFSQITFSFAVITRTHTPTQTQSVFPTHA